MKTAILKLTGTMDVVMLIDKYGDYRNGCMSAYNKQWLVFTECAEQQLAT